MPAESKRRAEKSSIVKAMIQSTTMLQSIPPSVRCTGGMCRAVLLTTTSENPWRTVLRTMAAIPGKPAVPVERSVQKITRMPANPSSVPPTLKAFSRSPGRKKCENIATTNGYVAKRIDARPEPMYCSPQ